MGKAAGWFRGLLGLKKPETPSAAAEGSGSKPPKRRWSFVKSRKDRGTRTDGGGGGGDGRPAAGPGGEDANRHAIAVAAATAAVAEAAMAAAQAAAAAVKLTGSGRPCAVAPAHVRERAAVRIQAAFRAYLSRRALHALRGLVKLQALVRGHIIRKQTADMLRGIQALLRAQARARVGRVQRSESPLSSSKSSQLQCPDPATPEKFEQEIRVKSLKYERSSSMLKRSGSKNKTCLMDKSNNIHEANPNRRTSDQRSHSFTTSKDSTARQTAPSSSSCEVQSLIPLKLSHEVEESSPFCSASSSPQFFSVSSKAGSSRTGPFTPAKSDGSRSFLSSSYSNYPNYMSCTESSRAKVRSYSAPKQRPQYERSSSTKKNSIQGFGDSKPSAHRVSALHANFTNKAYPGSGRLDRLGMPLAYDHGPFPNRY